MLKKLAGLVFISTMSLQVHADQLTVGLGENSLQALGYSKDHFTGTHKDIFQCVFDNLGDELDIQILPVARMLRYLERNAIDLALPLGPNKDRDVYARFTKPVIRADYSIVTSEKDDFLHGIVDRPIAVLNESSSYRLALSRGAITIPVDSYRSSVLMTKAGRVAGAVLPDPIIEAMDPSMFAGLRIRSLENRAIGMYVSKGFNGSQGKLVQLDRSISRCHD